MDQAPAITLSRVRRAVYDAERRNVKLDPRTIINILDRKKA